MSCSEKNSISPKGRVFLVGAGPGDPELLTLKAYRLLSQAKVVIYDRLANHAILDVIPSDCEIIYAGKRKHLHTLSQAQIQNLMLDRATQGLDVVRLKGGDPGIFGRMGEEIAALEEANVGYEVVPGITAATGAAASIGLSLTHRDAAQAVTFITAHGRSGVLEIDWDLIQSARQTIVIYMGLSLLPALVEGLLSRGKPPSTPFSAISQATRPDEIVIHSTLGGLLLEPQLSSLQSPTLLVLHYDARYQARVAQTDFSLQQEQRR
ncbi:MAG: uroporphyrinogen-III C-methyltransferase [Pseudomonadota bacterium]